MAASDALLQLPAPQGGPLVRALFALARPTLSRFFCLPTLNAMYRETASDDTDAFLARALARLAVDVRLEDQELERIPANGPLIVAANHPFGAVEGLILAQALRRLRPDVRIMANSLLSLIPEMRDCLLSVDPFGRPDSLARNIAPLRQAMRWLKDGGCLGVFPAGEVSALSLRRRSLADKAWSPTIGGLARRTRAAVVPVHFSGSNRLLFHLLGLLHPRLRTVLLPRELLHGPSQPVRMSVGAAIPPARLAGFADDAALMAYVRLRCYALGKRRPAPTVVRPAAAVLVQTPVVAPVDRPLLEAEVAALPPASVLQETADHLLLCARRSHIPHLVREVGRLREVTFRQVGEGTGRDIDLDRFDDHYEHLILWHKKDREVVGAYRLGATDEILASHGRQGLYAGTLFGLRSEFLDQVTPGLELGRSFVQQRYQKSFAPLTMLWKGLAAVVARRPWLRVLYGPVSISGDYRAYSRELLVRFLTEPHGAKAASGLGRLRLVRPRTPPRLRPLPLADATVRTVRRTCRDADDLGALISDLEPDGKGLPVLLKHYLRLGGRILAFNVDHDFNGCLDGLIYVDLLRTDPAILGRFMGQEACRSFLDWHQTRTSRPAA